MFTQVITAILVAIHLVASTPIYVGDTVEFHVAGFGNAESMGLTLVDSEGKTTGVICDRDPKGNKDGHWICPWTASAGKWSVHSITYKNKKGVFEVWYPKNQDKYPVVEPLPVPPPTPTPTPHVHYHGCGHDFSHTHEHDGHSHHHHHEGNNGHHDGGHNHVLPPYPGGINLYLPIVRR